MSNSKSCGKGIPTDRCMARPSSHTSITSKGGLQQTENFSLVMNKE